MQLARRELLAGPGQQVRDMARVLSLDVCERNARKQGGKIGGQQAAVYSLAGAMRYSRTPASRFRVSDSLRRLVGSSVRSTIRYSNCPTSPRSR